MRDCRMMMDEEKMSFKRGGKTVTGLGWAGFRRKKSAMRLLLAAGGGGLNKV